MGKCLVTPDTSAAGEKHFANIGGKDILLSVENNIDLTLGKVTKKSEGLSLERFISWESSFFPLNEDFGALQCSLLMQCFSFSPKLLDNNLTKNHKQGIFINLVCQRFFVNIFSFIFSYILLEIQDLGNKRQ